MLIVTEILRAELSSDGTKGAMLNLSKYKNKIKT